MSIFQNPIDEQKLCEILKVYVEEWGPENVIVSVPVPWKEYSNCSLGRVRLEFATENTVAIRVEYDSAIRLNFNVPLQTV